MIGTDVVEKLKCPFNTVFIMSMSPNGPKYNLAVMFSQMFTIPSCFAPCHNSLANISKSTLPGMRNQIYWFKSDEFRNDSMTSMLRFWSGEEQKMAQNTRLNTSETRIDAITRHSSPEPH